MLEHEKLVLACILLDRETVPLVSAILRPEMFVGEVNRQLYDKALELYEMGDPIEAVTIDPEAKNRMYLLELESPSSANAEYYAQQLREDFVVRELEKTCLETIDHIRGKRYPDLDSLLDNFETKVFKIADEGTEQKIVKVSEKLPMIHEAILDAKQGAQVKSGFLDLDYLIGGFASGDNIVVAGRPSMGKTAFCISIMRNICQAGGKCGIISLETTTNAIVRRLVSMIGKIEGVRLRNGMLTKEEKERIPAIMEELHKWQFYIDDTGAMNTIQLKAKARRAVAQFHLDLLVIDYLQLIHPSRRRDSRNDEVSEISRTLREIPKDLGIPIIAVSQLSRATERRESHRPQLSDLRESGSIEQDATMVLFVYRPEMYRLKEFEDGTVSENKAEIILAKQKDGATGDFKVLFQKEYTNFENLALDKASPPLTP